MALLCVANSSAFLLWILVVNCTYFFKLQGECCTHMRYVFKYCGSAVESIKPHPYLQLDWMILEIFSSLGDSVILWSENVCECCFKNIWQCKRAFMGIVMAGQLAKACVFSIQKFICMSQPNFSLWFSHEWLTHAGKAENCLLRCLFCHACQIV